MTTRFPCDNPAATTPTAAPEAPLRDKAGAGRPCLPLTCGRHGRLALPRPGRTLGKTLTFAALHFLVGFLVSYAFTGSIAIASGIALVEPLANTFVFYLHERAWARADRTVDARSARTATHLDIGCPEPA